MTKKHVQIGRHRVPITKLEQWIAALRSGRYKQGIGELYNHYNKGFCCLGVLDHVVEKKALEQINHKAMPCMDSWTYYINGDFYQKTWLSLDHLNDHKGASFADIADYLEWVYVWGVLE